MFIQPLPFSEIIYVISILFTWIYLIIGISGEYPVRDASQIHVSKKEFYSGNYSVNLTEKKIPDLKNPWILKNILMEHFHKTKYFKKTKNYFLPKSSMFPKYLTRRGPPAIHKIPLLLSFLKISFTS